jgi:hypothetical protein
MYQIHCCNLANTKSKTVLIVIVTYKLSQKWRTNGALRCRRNYRNVRKMFKKFYWTYLCWFGGLWEWHLTGQLFRNTCIKLSWQLPLIVDIITKYKINHYQSLILHNRKFRSFRNRKNYFKSTTVTLQGNDVSTSISLFTLYWR